MPRPLSRLCAPLLVLLGAPGTVHATLGIFEHGAGIPSLGMGGVSISFAQDTVAMTANPAHAATLGRRWDAGLDVFKPEATVGFRGNAAGPDESFRNTGRRYFPVPQGGYVQPLDARWSVGVAAFAAGLGPDYERNPYQRFGGDPRGSLFLTVAGVSTALAHRLTPDQVLGLSLNLSYQVLQIQGLEFLGALSETPQRVSNQGKDGALGLGLSLGWWGRLSPSLSAGAVYRSKSWTQKHDDYRGLLPDRGSLELPAIWSAGLAWTPVPDWTLAVDVQRYEYADEAGFGNRLERLTPERPLGAEGSAGFGFADQNVLKLGLAWRLRPTLTLRAGYIEASQIVQASQTLFDMYGVVPARRHYTAGWTVERGEWALSGYAYHQPEQTVRGRDSIPPSFGGGEADVAFVSSGVGLSLGRRLGR